MSKTLFRRLTFSQSSQDGKQAGSRPEHTEKLVKALLKTLEAYMSSKTPEKLAEIATKVNAVWTSVFDVNKATAPKKKYELAEELLLRPDTLKLLLIAFRLVQIDIKRKIRDIFLFMITWCSNQSAESCIPRSHSKTKFSPKICDQLYYCREEIIDIVAEGYDEPASCGFYNDIVREYVKDEICLLSLLDDNGEDSSGFAVRPYGCVWAVFERLTLSDQKTYFDSFDVTAAAFETIELIFSTNHQAVAKFFAKNYAQFRLTMQKLISSANFFVQSKSLHLLHQIMTTRDHALIRDQWLLEPQLLKTVVLAMQSNKKAVKTEAIGMFELFLRNPRNTWETEEFIRRNQIPLVKFCMNSAPIHYYQRNRIEQEDARLSRIAHRLLNWTLARPLTLEETKELEEAEKLQSKFFEEQSVQTGYQDIMEGVPTVSHEYKIPVPRFPMPLGEPMMFGNPMGVQIQQ